MEPIDAATAFGDSPEPEAEPEEDVPTADSVFGPAKTEADA